MWIEGIIVDFRKKQPCHAPPLNNDTAVEVVSSTEFLGVHIRDNLTWFVNTAGLVKKTQQRLHFLRRMRRKRYTEIKLRGRSTAVSLCGCAVGGTGGTG